MSWKDYVAVAMEKCPYCGNVTATDDQGECIECSDFDWDEAEAS